MMFFSWLLIFILALLPQAHAVPIANQGWQSGTLSSDALSVNCAQILLPFELGRLLIESNPTSARGEMDSSLRSGHPIKVLLQPQSGVTDTLSAITGTLFDGCEIMLSTSDIGDTITIPNTTGQIEFPDGIGVSINDPLRIYTFVYKQSKWVLESGGGSGGGGGGGNINVADGQRIDFTAVNLNTALEGLFVPRSTNCAMATGDGQICFDTDDKRIYLGTGTGIEQYGGGGTGGGCTSLGTCAAGGKVISGLDSLASGLVLKGSNGNACVFYEDSLGFTEACYSGYGTGGAALLAPRGLRTAPMPPGKFSVDGALCTRAYDVTLNALQVPVAITCADNDGATIYLFYGMPDGWDGVTFKVSSYVHTKTASPSGNVVMHWTGKCVVSGDTNGVNTWGSETAMTVSLASQGQHDVIITETAGNVPFTNCTGASKKGLWLRGQIDATGTTVTTATDQVFFDFVAEYGRKNSTD